MITLLKLDIWGERGSIETACCKVKASVSYFFQYMKKKSWKEPFGRSGSERAGSMKPVVGMEVGGEVWEEALGGSFVLIATRGCSGI